MRILIDECVDERLRNSFSAHDCQTVRYAGFAGLKNGDLLEAIESAHFDVLVTADRGWEHEQNLVGRNVAVVIILCEIESLEGFVATRTGVSQCPAYDQAWCSRKGSCLSRVAPRGHTRRQRPSLPIV